MMETDTIVLEHLPAIRRDMAKLADDVKGLKAEMVATRHIMSGVVTLQDRDHADISHLKVRVDRIEQRLDLVG